MSPRNFLLRCVEPGLALLPAYMTSDLARVMLMAIAGQESNLSARLQVGGPAFGYWQFENVGFYAVMEAQPSLGQSVLTTCDIPAPVSMDAVTYNDPVACAFARLLLWTDVAALPAIGDAAGAWAYYERNWRPGKPDQTRWGAAYATAVATVGAWS